MSPTRKYREQQESSVQVGLAVDEGLNLIGCHQVDANGAKCLPKGMHQFYDSSDDEECMRDTLKDFHETTNIPEAIGYYNTRYEIDFITDQTANGSAQR